MKGLVFMKRLFFVFLALVFILSACSPEEPIKENGSYNIFGNIDKDKPSAGNYFTYTPIIDIFSPELGEFSTFLDFYGNKFIMDSGTDKAFLFSYNLLNGKSENLTNKLGFHSASVLSYDGDFYFIGEKNGELFLFCRNSAGEMLEEICIHSIEFEMREGYVTQKNFCNLFRSGKNIVAIIKYEGGGICTVCYDPETGETLSAFKKNARSNHETLPVNGFITYTEEKNGLFTIFAFEPTNDKTQIFGPSVTEKILCSAFDGKHFVWSTKSGIFYKPLSGKTVQISDKGGKFAFLGRNFVVYSTGEKLVLYRIDKNYEGGYNYSGLEFVYADESIAVFKNPEGIFGEEYLSVSIKRGEEPKSLADAADEGPFTIAVDGYLYYCFFEGSGGIVPTEEQISGKITSVYHDSSTCPRKNNQSNDTWFLGARYAFVDGMLLLENINGKGWYKCEKSWALSEMNLD